MIVFKLFLIRVHDRFPPVQDRVSAPLLASMSRSPATVCSELLIWQDKNGLSGIRDTLSSSLDWKHDAHSRRAVDMRISTPSSSTGSDSYQSGMQWVVGCRTTAGRRILISTRRCFAALKGPPAVFAPRSEAQHADYHSRRPKGREGFFVHQEVRES